MTVKESLLYTLEKNKGNALSGEQLAKELGVSRAAVWKAIKELQRENHTIKAIAGSGYTMLKNSDVLTKEGVLLYLNNKQVDLYVKDSVTSTNIIAKEIASGAPHGSAVIANCQTQGRGRLGRTFSSPPNTGLYISCILKNNVQITQGLSITAAAAVAVCRSIKKLTGKHNVRVKWVNDLYIDEKKCGGILCESSTDIQTGYSNYIVVGIGLNLYAPPNGFDEQIANIATHIFNKDEIVSRCELAATIINELLLMCDDLSDFSFMQQYKELNIVQNRQITVLQNDTQYTAYAKEILDNGHLVIKLSDGSEKELSFGEVSLKL